MLPEPDHRSVDARLAVQAHGGTNPPNRCTPGSRTRGRSTAPASGCHDDAANAKVPQLLPISSSQKRDRVLNWTASANLSDIFRAYVEDGWFARCDRRVCLFGQSQPGFFAEHDFWTEDQLDDNPIYRDFFRPRGLGWSAGTGATAAP